MHYLFIFLSVFSRAVGFSIMNTQILVVQDDIMIQSFLRVTLESEGYRVLTAANIVEMLT